jgi:hypothetical protein
MIGLMEAVNLNYCLRTAIGTLALLMGVCEGFKLSDLSESSSDETSSTFLFIIAMRGTIFCFCASFGFLLSFLSSECGTMCPFGGGVEFL